ncbi:MAG TPA: glycosyltransferase family 1 protein [Chloroflexia bacterium]|jgi:glycosyltransferase involved in cell wall biosynthesis
MLVGFEASALHGHKSGVGYYTENMMASIMAASPENRYVLFSGRNVRNDDYFPLGSELEYNDRHFPVRAVWMQTVLPSALRHVRPDLCHFTNYLAPVQCPCPSIVTIYDMTVFITPRFHTFKKFVLDRTLMPIVARRADAIVTVSNSARNDILRYLKVPRDKVRVIPGAASSHFRPTTDQAKLEDVRSRYGLDVPYILYVGTIEPRKNLVRLVRAFARLKKRSLPHKLLIVGQAGWQVSPVYAEVERLGLTKDVVFTGYVPLEDLPPLYTMAESLAFPSLYEGFGLPVIEAMACGTPVVTSRSSSLREISGDAALLVDPLSVDELEEALYRIHSDPGLRACLRERGIARAALFTWETTARATLDLYKQVRSRSVGVKGLEAGVRERERHESVVGDY